MATASPSSSDPPINSGKDKDTTIPENSEKTGKSSVNSDSEDKKCDDDSATRAFECNICLDTASDAVISMCGHLFCWPCLHQWLETRPQRQICPVCKAGIGRDKVVPLYGRDGDQKIPEINPFHQGQGVKDQNRNQLEVQMVVNLVTCSILEAFKCLSASEPFLLDFLQPTLIGAKMVTTRDQHPDQLSLTKNNFCIVFSSGSLLHSYFGF